MQPFPLNSPFLWNGVGRVGKDLKDHGVPIPLPWEGISPSSPGCCKPQGRARSPCKASPQQRIPSEAGNSSQPWEELCQRCWLSAAPGAAGAAGPTHSLCSASSGSSLGTSSTGKAFPTPQCCWKGNGSCESRLGLPTPVAHGQGAQQKGHGTEGRALQRGRGSRHDKEKAHPCVMGGKHTQSWQQRRVCE